MSDKIPYVQMKLVFEEMMNSTFGEMGKLVHGWSKDEFLANYKEEMIAETEEETYDIVLTAPNTLQ